jgi:hypothetical protein
VLREKQPQRNIELAALVLAGFQAADLADLQTHRASDAVEELRRGHEPLRPAALTSRCGVVGVAQPGVELMFGLGRLSPLRTATPCVFMAISGSAHGAPRWLILEGETGGQT